MWDVVGRPTRVEVEQVVTVRTLRATVGQPAQTERPGQRLRAARTPHGRRRSRSVVVAGLLAGAVLLGGCSAPGTAAQVEGHTVSRSTLDAAHHDLSTVVPEITAPSILIALVAAPYFIHAAAENGVGVSADRARDALTTKAADAGLQDTPTFGPGAVEVMRFTMAVQNLRSLPDGEQVLQEVDAEVRSLDIEINPRYGELDRASGTIVATTLPWIVAAK